MDNLKYLKSYKNFGVTHDGMWRQVFYLKLAVVGYAWTLFFVVCFKKKFILSNAGLNLSILYLFW